jgi:hypothetical protein
MLVILQLIRLQGEMFLRSPKQWLFWAFAFFSHFYIAFVAANALKDFSDKEFPLSGLLLVFLGYIVLTGFFPRYKKLQNIIQRHHPYKPWQRWRVLLRFAFYLCLCGLFSDAIRQVFFALVRFLGAAARLPFQKTYLAFVASPNAAAGAADSIGGGADAGRKYFEPCIFR